MIPIIRSGKFHAGSDLQCGSNVVIDVAEEMIVGNRCVIPDNAYFGGRRIEILDDFYGYSWECKRLDIGRGRIDEENAVLTVGSRCTFHDNKIDLARRVSIASNVGLSPEVAIYTHYYWQSPLEGFPCKYAPVDIHDGAIIGYRSVILPGSKVGYRAVVGAQSVVYGEVKPLAISAGNPAKWKRQVETPKPEWREEFITELVREYKMSCQYRNLTVFLTLDHQVIRTRNCFLDLNLRTCEGEEDEYTDDLRDFLFKHGIKIFTKRPFKKLPRRG